MNYNFNLLKKQVNKIVSDDYNHENPWLLINRSLYRAFKRFFNAELKKLTNGEIIIDNFSGSWTSLYFFLKHNDEQAYDKDCYIYISLDWQCFSSTVLRLVDDSSTVLYRTAKHLRDYTGGSNNFCKLSEVIEKAVELMRKEVKNNAL